MVEKKSIEGKLMEGERMILNDVTGGCFYGVIVEFTLRDNRRVTHLCGISLCSTFKLLAHTFVPAGFSLAIVTFLIGDLIRKSPPGQNADLSSNKIIQKRINS